MGKKNLFNIDMTLSFTNQQRMSNKELAHQMSRILHDLFGDEVTMETITDNDGYDEHDEDEVEDAQIEYPDNEITFGEELEHNSNAHRRACRHNQVITLSILTFLV